MKQKRTTACRVWLCMALILATALGVNAQGKITLKLTDEPLHYRCDRHSASGGFLSAAEPGNL